jgi:dihydroorotase
VEYDNAAFGMIGVETSLALSLALVSQKVLSLSQAIEKLTCNPARILHLEKGKSRNSPFNGWRLKGQAVYSIVSGKVVFALED